MLNLFLKFISAVITIFSFAVFAAGYQDTTPDPKLLQLTISSDKALLLPGEPLELTFVVTNVSDRPIHTHKINIERGDTQLFISHENKPFREYQGNWGLLDIVGDNIILKPNERMIATAIVHYNYVKPLPENIGTYYAFYQPGVYSLKALFNYWEDGKKRTESAVIKLNIKKPEGNDASVWQRIKDEPDVAYFIYVNGKTFVDKSDRNKSLRITGMLNEILSAYPATTYSNYIATALATHTVAVKQWRTARIMTAERALRQAGQLLHSGKEEYGIKMLTGSANIFQEIELFPKDATLDVYIGLAYLLNRDYGKAIEYLDPIIKSSDTIDSRLLIEATTFAHLALGDEDAAIRLIKVINNNQVEQIILNNLRNKIKNRDTFSLQAF
jgi:hypothetical protein